MVIAIKQHFLFHAMYGGLLQIPPVTMYGSYLSPNLNYEKEKENNQETLHIDLSDVTKGFNIYFRSEVGLFFLLEIPIK